MLFGSTTPRLWTRPLVTGRPGPCGCGCALSPKTSLGFSAVDFAEDVLAIRVLPWQRWLLIHSMELRPDGRFRFRTVVVLVARQNGKTTIVEVKNLWKMFVLRVPLVIGTAQNLDISEESWDKAVEICESIPALKAEIAHVDKTNGKKALRLHGGSRWKIAAASRKGGRGLSGDDVNLDELREHQNWESWAAVTKTTMARRNPQVWAFSNAGDDKSIVLNDLQEKGRAAVENPELADPSLGLFEWSAPDDVTCTCGRPDGGHLNSCRLQNRAAWAQANPSLGYTVTEEALASALATDPEPIFRTECLCQRVEDLAGEWQVIPEDAWRDRADLRATPEDPVALAIDVSPEGWSCVGVAGRTKDGRLLAEIVRHERGTSWVVPLVEDLVERHGPCAVVLDAGGPAGALLAPLRAAGIEPVIPSYREVAQACGAFHSAVCGDAPDLVHLDQGPLTAAVAGAQMRPLGDAWAWNRRHISVDISPLVAVTLAAWAHAVHAHSNRPQGLQSMAVWA